MKTFDFKDYTNCHFAIGKYTATDSLAVMIVDNNNSVIVIVTLASADSSLPNKEEYAYVKNYSENEGVLDFLIENEFIDSIDSYTSFGFVNAPLVKFDLNRLKEYGEII